MNEEINHLKNEIEVLNKRVRHLELKEKNRKILLIVKIVLFIILLVMIGFFLFIYKTNIDSILGIMEGWKKWKKEL